MNEIALLTSQREFSARKYVSLILVALLLTATLFLATPNIGEGKNAATPLPGISVRTSTDSELILDIISPPLLQTEQIIEQQKFVKLSMDGYGRIGEVGMPDLPQHGILVALPPNGVPELSIRSVDNYQLEVEHVAPAVEQSLVSYDFNDADSLPQFEERLRLEPAGYATDHPYPTTLASIANITTIRDQRVAHVLINPIQWNSAAGAVTHHRQLELAISFTFPNGPITTPNVIRPESDTFERLIAANVVNAEVARSWRTAPDGGVAPQASPCLDENAFRLTVEETGIYSIGYAELIAAGLSETVAEEKIRLCYGADEMDIQIIDGDSTSNLGAGDQILFYGEAIKTQETDKNVYWLTYGDASAPDGQRMASTTDSGSGTGTGSYTYVEHLEHDNPDLGYISRFPSTDANDHWYWQYISEGLIEDQQLETTFDIHNLALGAYNVAVSVNVVGHLSIRHHKFELHINDTYAATLEFTDNGFNPPHTLVANVSSALFQNGENELALIAIDNGVVGQSHIVWVDWIELELRRFYVAVDDQMAFTQPTSGYWDYSVSGFSGTPSIFDVSDPLHPSIVADATGSGTVSFTRMNSTPASYELWMDGTYLSVSAIQQDAAPLLTGTGLQDSSQQADYIIITDPMLEASAAPLINLRESQGHTVSTVFVQDIFDEFSYGLYDPVAIQRFLNYAYFNWQSPQPTYVLLLGDASYDHRNVKELNGVGGNWVPTYLRSGIDINIGETAADNQYVDFNGDNLPEMLLGRLPANSVAQANDMIARIITYEESDVDPTWHGQHLFVADNGYEIPTGGGSDCTLDPAGDFFATVLDFIDEVFPVDSQFYTLLFYAPPECYPRDGYPNYEPYYRNNPDTMQSDIADAFHAGQQFVIYTGHSGSTFWAKDGTGLLNIESVNNLLRNGDKTPIMLPMTCLEGSYHRPEFESLSEALLKRPSAGATAGGAVASYAPTGLQVQSGHDFLIEGFYDSAFGADTEIIGEAIYEAKLFLYSGTLSYQDLQDTFMLLGDPAMNMRTWEFSDQLFLPSTASH